MALFPNPPAHLSSLAVLIHKLQNTTTIKTKSEFELCTPSEKFHVISAAATAMQLAD